MEPRVRDAVNIQGIAWLVQRRRFWYVNLGVILAQQAHDQGSVQCSIRWRTKTGSWEERDKEGPLSATRQEGTAILFKSMPPWESRMANRATHRPTDALALQMRRRELIKPSMPIQQIQPRQQHRRRFTASGISSTFWAIIGR